MIELEQVVTIWGCEVGSPRKLGLLAEEAKASPKPFLKVVTDTAAKPDKITFNFHVGNVGKVSPRTGVGKTAKFSVATATSSNVAAADWTDGTAMTRFATIAR